MQGSDTCSDACSDTCSYYPPQALGVVAVVAGALGMVVTWSANGDGGGGLSTMVVTWWRHSAAPAPCGRRRRSLE